MFLNGYKGGLVIHTVLSVQVVLGINSGGLVIRIYEQASLSVLLMMYGLILVLIVNHQGGSRYRYCTDYETLVYSQFQGLVLLF